MLFENLRRDPRIFWLGEASAVLLTDDVNALGGDAVTHQERKQAFARLKVPPAAVLTDATLIRIGQVVGAAEIVVGTLQLGRRRPHRSRTDDRASTLVACRRTSPNAVRWGDVRHLRTSRAPAGAALDEDAGGHPSRASSSGRARQLHQRAALRVAARRRSIHLWAALKLQPTFERARLALWDVYVEPERLRARPRRRCGDWAGFPLRGARSF